MLVAGAGDDDEDAQRHGRLARLHLAERPRDPTDLPASLKREELVAVVQVLPGHAPQLGRLGLERDVEACRAKLEGRLVVHVGLPDGAVADQVAEEALSEDGDGVGDRAGRGAHGHVGADGFEVVALCSPGELALRLDVREQREVVVEVVPGDDLPVRQVGDAAAVARVADLLDLDAKLWQHTSPPELSPSRSIEGADAG